MVIVINKTLSEDYKACFSTWIRFIHSLSIDERNSQQELKQLRSWYGLVQKGFSLAFEEEMLW